MKAITFALIIPALLMIACGGPDQVAPPAYDGPTYDVNSTDRHCTEINAFACSTDRTRVYTCLQIAAGNPEAGGSWNTEKQCDYDGKLCGWTDADAGTIGCVDSGQ